MKKPKPEKSGDGKPRVSIDSRVAERESGFFIGILLNKWETDIRK